MPASRNTSIVARERRCIAVRILRETHSKPRRTKGVGNGTVPNQLLAVAHMSGWGEKRYGSLPFFPRWFYQRRDLDGFSTNSGLFLPLGLAHGKRAETGRVGYNRRRASRFASLEEQSKTAGPPAIVSDPPGFCSFAMRQP